MGEFNEEVQEAKREHVCPPDAQPDNVHYRVALHSGLKVLLKEVVQEKDRLLQKNYLSRVFKWYTAKLDSLIPKGDRDPPVESTSTAVLPPIPSVAEPVSSDKPKQVDSKDVNACYQLVESRVPSITTPTSLSRKSPLMFNSFSPLHYAMEQELQQNKGLCAGCKAPRRHPRPPGPAEILNAEPD